MDTSTDVQKRAYQFLENAVKKRTEYFVIEAGVDADTTVNATIPPEILDILQRIINLDEANLDTQVILLPFYLSSSLILDKQNVFGYLLSWMLLFDLFKDAVRRYPSFLLFETYGTTEPEGSGKLHRTAPPSRHHRVLLYTKCP